MKRTFHGGIEIDEHKNTSNIAMDRSFSPEKVIIPMSQHIGTPCLCIVKKGDIVKKGQMIGQPQGNLSCPIHASVSGKVLDVIEQIGVSGQKTISVLIENDGLNTLDESVCPKDYEAMSVEEIIEQIRLAGISGLGGATFPTYAKILSALGKVDKLILNCSECEPYITANHRLMLEHPNRILKGTKILLKVFGLEKAHMGISDNKPDAIKLFKEFAESEKFFEVTELKTKYPQGDERQLIYALTKRRVPLGKLPADVGCVVFNPETVAAIERAFTLGMPLIEKIVTLDGDRIKEPRCVKVPIGAEYEEIMRHCGYICENPQKIISGGTMMGFTVWNTKMPVSKGCSSILVFENSDFKTPENTYCIRCGKCVEACPMRLMPSYIAQYARKGLLDECERLNARACVECGCCSYVCPAKVPVSQYIRTVKAKIIAKTRRQK